MVTKTSRLGFFAAAAALALVLSVRAGAQVAKGSAFPVLAEQGLSGTVPDTAGKVTLVDFWASWCAPCKASFPAYSSLQQDFAPKGLVIVAVSVDDDPASYASFVAKHKPLFPTVHDAQHKLVASVQVPTMPTSYLIDRSGKVRFIHAGFHGDATERELRAEVTALLGEKAAP
ncbi:MAG TPA: TlpA disulfide reductase family protein [Opitutaceae bacterium]|nr:TlpA disulfide reductase family protein [Opitutaceae bacterium]